MRQNRQSAIAGNATLPEVDDDLLAGIDRWLALAATDDRAAADAAERRHLRHLVTAAAAGDDLRAVLLALAEQADSVVLTLTGTGREIRGLVVAAGRDFVVLRAGPDDVPWFVALDGIDSMRLPPGRAWAGGVGRGPGEAPGGGAPSRGSLASVLAGLGEEAPRVQVVTSSTSVTGVLGGVGAEVVVVDDGRSGPVRIVPLAAVRAVALLDWG